MRAGYLGLAALRILMSKARNVKIKGTPRLKYVYYVTVYTSEIVLQRSTKRRSPRPFQRILQDLFEFLRSLNSLLYLLVIKDEYSRKLFSYYLKSKSLIKVLLIIQYFKVQTRRQYSLLICKIKHDNKKVVITI